VKAKKIRQFAPRRLNCLPVNDVAYIASYERRVATMNQRKFRFGMSAWLVVLTLAVLVGLMLLLTREPTTAQQPLPTPPEGQTYVGTRDCSSCHLDQFMDWRTTQHSKAFDTLPAKYRADANCLKCHTTGHGAASGFASVAATPNLVGIACEACHGPGSKHVEAAKSFGQAQLTAEQEAFVRSTIHRMLPKNVCVDCHVTRAHQKHPPFDK
jgi:hypothetical protein